MRAAGRSILVACVVATAAGRAAAAVPLAVTRTSRAVDCPSPAELAARVDARVGRHAVAPHAEEDAEAAASEGTVFVGFEKHDDGYRAVVRHGREGERILTHRAPTCAGVALAVELTLALLLDEDEARALAPAPLMPPGAPPPAREDARATGGAPPASEVPRVGERPRALVDGFAGVGAGLLRSPSPFAAADAGVGSFGRFSARAGGMFVFAQSVARGSGVVETSLVAGYADLCLRALGSAQAELAVCGTPHAGAIHGRGSGYATDGAVSRAWLAAGLTLFLRGPIAGPLGWSARVEGLVPLTRERFDIDGAGAAYDPSPAAVLVSVGPALTLF